MCIRVNLNEESIKIIDGAYRIREKCDYSDFFLVSKEESAVQMEHAAVFVKTVEGYILKKVKGQMEENSFNE